MLTGAAEVVTAILILVPRTRLLGALGGIGVLAGAIGFHLSPWLGISVPGMGHSLFFMALGLLALNAALFFFLRKQKYSLFAGE